MRLHVRLAVHVWRRPQLVPVQQLGVRAVRSLAAARQRYDLRVSDLLAVLRQPIDNLLRHAEHRVAFVRDVRLVQHELRAVKEYLRLRLCHRQRIDFRVEVAKKEEHQLNERREACLVDFSGPVHDELGHEPTKVPHPAVLLALRLLQHVLRARLHLRVDPCVEAEHARQHEHLERLPAVNPRALSRWQSETAAHVSPPLALASPDALAQSEVELDFLRIKVVGVEHTQELASAKNLPHAVPVVLVPEDVAHVRGAIVEVFQQTVIYFCQSFAHVLSQSFPQQVYCILLQFEKVFCHFDSCLMMSFEIWRSMFSRDFLPVGHILK